MGVRTILLSLLGGLLVLSGLYAFQRPFREYPGFEYSRLSPASGLSGEDRVGLCPLDVSAHEGVHGGGGLWVLEARGGSDWTQGHSNWTIDYPRSDRHFPQALRRLTRIHVRSVEQPVNLDDGDEVYNWPWLYAVEVGHWDLTDAQAKMLREYLLRGGFFMCDDFHGTDEWAVFAASMQRCFPTADRGDRQAATRFFTPSTIWTTATRCPARSICARGQTLRVRWLRPALARHLRRQGPPDGRHLLRHGPGRFLGVRRRSASTPRSSPRSESASA